MIDVLRGRFGRLNGLGTTVYDELVFPADDVSMPRYERSSVVERPTMSMSRGLPRAVNNIATQALIAAMAERKNIIDEQSARTAVNEITSD